MTETQYVCVAPLIDVVVGADANGEGGALQRVHQGGGLPLRDLYQRQVDHLLDRGLIVAAEITGGLESAVVGAALAASVAAGVDPATAPGADGDDAEPADPPAKSAAKAEWVACAVRHGAVEAEAEATTKEDLIAIYGGS